MFGKVQTFLYVLTHFSGLGRLRLARLSLIATFKGKSLVRGKGGRRERKRDKRRTGRLDKTEKGIERKG